jgi:glutamate-1-semialdehyde 2,1-aminomutase
VLPYNDLAAVEAVLADQGDDIACFITEAATGNMGVVSPGPGFNAGLRDITINPGGGPWLVSPLRGAAGHAS